MRHKKSHENRGSTRRRLVLATGISVTLVLASPVPGAQASAYGWADINDGDHEGALPVVGEWLIPDKIGDLTFAISGEGTHVEGLYANLTSFLGPAGTPTEVCTWKLEFIYKREDVATGTWTEHLLFDQRRFEDEAVAPFNDCVQHGEADFEIVPWWELLYLADHDQVCAKSTWRPYLGSEEEFVTYACHEIEA